LRGAASSCSLHFSSAGCVDTGPLKLPSVLHGKESWLELGLQSLGPLTFFSKEMIFFGLFMVYFLKLLKLCHHIPKALHLLGKI
jgi:hypothetical protein